jgi:hypothetical protein
LADFEDNLDANLRRLHRKLGAGAWFDNVDIGYVFAKPKRLNGRGHAPGKAVSVPPASSGHTELRVQMRLAPSPEFATVEVLFLQQFGPALQQLVSDAVIGNRLDIRSDELKTTSRWLFEYWPRRYSQFQFEPIEEAKLLLAEPDGAATILSADMAGFYDTIDPSFLLAADFVAVLRAAPIALPSGYRRAVRSLLDAYHRFRLAAGRILGLKVSVGVPIGALTSRLVSNLALESMDKLIESNEKVVCYRRYVDDFVVVLPRVQEEEELEVLRTIVPLDAACKADDGPIPLNVGALKRPGSEFAIQRAKLKVHRLAGQGGIAFLGAIQSDFGDVVSRSRSFVDELTSDGDALKGLVRLNGGESPIRTLREADQIRLARFALSSRLASLERVSRLVVRSDARKLVQAALKSVVEDIEIGDNWVDGLDASLRVLKLTVATDDARGFQKLNAKLQRAWGTTDAVRHGVARVVYREFEVSVSRTSLWVSIRNYLHKRRVEAICSVIARQRLAAKKRSQDHITLTCGTRILGAAALRRRAQALSRSDLRALDRVDDFALGASVPGQYAIQVRDWNLSQGMRRRFAYIKSFVALCDDQDALPWHVQPARLFLSTRPPSYFDVARQWLRNIESDGVRAGLFDQIVSVVNAIRGTSYSDPAANRIDEQTVYIGNLGGLAEEGRDPHVILGNVVLEDSYWKAAASQSERARQAGLTLERLYALSRILDRARSEAFVVRNRPSILVLPELALPRAWFRSVATHVVAKARHALVTGLEYLHLPEPGGVLNQVAAVFPTAMSAALTWIWTKRRPANEEKAMLQKLRRPLRFAQPQSAEKSRIVVSTEWGAFSVLVCSELIEARRVADLLGRVQLVICPSWNVDTASYDHLIQSVGLQLHAVVAIANNGYYSDCRVWGPHALRWKRDMCRLIARRVNEVVAVTPPIGSLRAFQESQSGSHGFYTDEVGEDAQWKPLPPDWP